MAEGHAVIRWARALAVLEGEPVASVRLPKRWGEAPQALVGQHLTRTSTHGKHLTLHFSGGLAIHTHAMQYGSWQVGLRGMALRKEARFVRLALATAAHEAVFYHGPIIELLTEAELAAHGALNRLGPDVMAEHFDRAEAFRRLHAEGDRPLGDAIMDQRVVAGIGNIFKSEGLFLAALDPRRPAGSVTAAEAERLWDALIPLMWAGTERFGRTKTTTPALQEAGHLRYVYQRKGKPCLRCSTPIAVLPQGDLDRKTYHCPGCQH